VSVLISNTDHDQLTAVLRAAESNLNAAFNTATTLARAVRVHTGYARANHETHTLIRQVLTGSGDIDPSDGFLSIRLDPLPTRRATTAIAELCEHLTTTHTRYPGTNLTLRYEIKTRP
jgi:hypothetical protein